MTTGGPQDILLISFIYYLRSNCETFCNMIIFGIPHSTQSDGTRNWLKSKKGFLCNSLFKTFSLGLFNSCNILKYSLWCGGLPLRDQMEMRLIERDLMPSNDEYTACSLDKQQSSLNYLFVFAICAFLFAYLCMLPGNP
jgi:hypothetical protein